MPKKSILIIGKNGFVARNLFEFLSKADEYDVSSVGSKELNLLDEIAIKSFLEKNYYDVIIDCAVWSPQYATLMDIGREVTYDLRMFFNIAKYHELYGKLIHFGSGAEYNKDYPIVEVDEDCYKRVIPSNDYGFAKYVINQYIEKSDNIYNLRVFGLYGKYENYGKTFISGACAKAVCDIPISIRQNVLFDYLYIDDFCKMLKAFVEIEKPCFHSYNIVSGRKIDLISLAKMVTAIADRVDHKKIDIIVCKEGLANEYTANNRRIIEEIGNISLTNYENSIEDMYLYFKENKNSIDKQSLLYQ